MSASRKLVRALGLLTGSVLWAGLAMGCDPVVCLGDCKEDDPSMQEESGPGEDPSAGEDPDPSASSEGPEEEPEGGSSTGDPAGSSSGEVEVDACSTATCVAPSAYTGPGECDPYAQDCAPGERCAPAGDGSSTSWSSTVCTPIEPDASQLGEPCSLLGDALDGRDTCDIGLMCSSLDYSDAGTCVELCGCGPDSPTCQGENSVCVVGNGGALPLCYERCDPLEPTCAQGAGCYPSEDDFLCVPDASGPDMGGLGDPCDFGNTCNPGLTCAEAAVVPGCDDAAGLGCCTDFCRFDDPDACDNIPGTECLSVFEDHLSYECNTLAGRCVAP